jgi:hypothetical protein
MTSHAILFHNPFCQSRDIEDQRNRPVAKNGAPANSFYFAQHLSNRTNHGLHFSPNLLNDNAGLATRVLNHYNVLFIVSLDRNIEETRRMEQREDFPPKIHHPAFSASVVLQAFYDYVERDDKERFSKPHAKTVYDRKGQGETNANEGARTTFGLYVDSASHGLNLTLNHVHSDASPGEVGYRICCGESGLEDQTLYFCCI